MTNIMYDRRVHRGSTLGTRPHQVERTEHINNIFRQQRPISQLASSQATASRRAASTTNIHRPPTPPPVYGRVHNVTQTDPLVEDLRQKKTDREMTTQTDAELDYDSAVLFTPKASGDDVETQIVEREGEMPLFDFDLHVDAIVETLVEKALTTAFVEVCHEQEEELVAEQSQRWAESIEARRDILRQLILKQLRREDEQAFARQQGAEYIKQKALAEEKRNAKIFAERAVRAANAAAIAALPTHDPVFEEVRDVFIPHLHQQTNSALTQRTGRQQFFDKLVISALANIQQRLHESTQQRQEEEYQEHINARLDGRIVPRKSIFSQAQRAVESNSASAVARQTAVRPASAFADAEGEARRLISIRDAKIAAERKYQRDVIIVQSYQRARVARTRVAKLRAIRQLAERRAAMTPAEWIASLSGASGMTVSDTENGVVVTDVTPFGAANYATISIGDRILAIDKQQITSADSFHQLIKRSSVGGVVTLSVVRIYDGREEECPLEVSSVEAEFSVQAVRERRTEAEMSVHSQPLINTEEATEIVSSEKFNVKSGVVCSDEKDGRVRISKVASGTSAAIAGLTENMIIVSVNSVPLKSSKDWKSVSETWRVGDVIDIEVRPTVTSDEATVISMECHGVNMKKITMEWARSIRLMAGLPVSNRIRGQIQSRPQTTTGDN